MIAQEVVVVSDCAMRHLWLLLGLSLAAVFAAAAQASDLSPVISVGIFSGHDISACSITARAAITLENERGRRLADFPSGTRLEAAAEGGLVVVRCEAPRGQGQSRRYVFSSSEPIRVEPEGLTARSYRGQVALFEREGRLVLVNRAGLEDYLRGVLPSEVPAGFHPEALRAQAIVARTYAVATRGRHERDGYDLCDRSHCQVFLGTEREDPRLDAAIADTAGLILTYEGEPIQAVYHAVCGGRTAANETAWPGARPLPYLRPVSDSNGDGTWCGTAPGAAWTRSITQSQLATVLARFGVGAPISSIEPAARDAGGRPREFILHGAYGECRVGSSELRSIMNRALGGDTLPSADFEAAANGEMMVFAGRGYGHGVGLCQWGANAMAAAGSTAAEVLQHYYSGATIALMSGEVAR